MLYKKRVTFATKTYFCDQNNMESNFIEFSSQKSMQWTADKQQPQVREWNSWKLLVCTFSEDKTTKWDAVIKWKTGGRLLLRQCFFNAMLYLATSILIHKQRTCCSTKTSSIQKRKTKQNKIKLVTGKWTEPNNSSCVIVVKFTFVKGRWCKRRRKHILFLALKRKRCIYVQYITYQAPQIVTCLSVLLSHLVFNLKTKILLLTEIDMFHVQGTIV